VTATDAPAAANPLASLRPDALRCPGYQGHLACSSRHGFTCSKDCSSVLKNSYMNHLPQKKLPDGVQRAFQLMGINCGQLISNILEYGVDHRSPGSLPFPSERRHFGADSPPVGWIIASFH
jgi:hypothetical protein